MSEPRLSKADKEKNKKIVVIILLSICCLVTLFMILSTNEPRRSETISLTGTDTLLEHEFHEFNIPAAQIRVYSVKTGSLLTRKVYRVEVAGGFSKTYFHAELASLLRPYRITTPAKVYLPDQDMDIQLYYHHTVIRTLELKTDPKLVLDRHPCSILLYTDHKPDHTLIDKITSKGLDIPLVLKVNEASQAKEWESAIRQSHLSLIYWLTSPGDESTGAKDWYLNDQLKNLKKIFKNPTTLLFPDINQQSKTLISKDDNLFGISTIDASKALSINGNTDQDQFNQTLKQFAGLAALDKRPILLIKATDEDIAWLNNDLPEYQKGGLLLVPPITQRH